MRVRPEAVGAQPSPQSGAADAEPAGRLGQLAVRLLQGVEDRQPFALRERRRVITVGQEDRLTELRRALLQRAGPAAQADEPLSQGTAAQERLVAQTVHYSARALVRVDHPAVDRKSTRLNSSHV